MLIINFETIKEKINDYYISKYYIADNLEQMLVKNNWAKIWMSRKIKYANELYADFDLLDYVFQNDAEKLQYATWVDSNFGKIDDFIEFSNDFYVDRKIDRYEMMQEIENAKENEASIFIFEFEEIREKHKKEEMI